MKNTNLFNILQVMCTKLSWCLPFIVYYYITGIIFNNIVFILCRLMYSNMLCRMFKSRCILSTMLGSLNEQFVLRPPDNSVNIVCRSKIDCKCMTTSTLYWRFIQPNQWYTQWDNKHYKETNTYLYNKQVIQLLIL